MTNMPTLTSNWVACARPRLGPLRHSSRIVHCKRNILRESGITHASSAQVSSIEQQNSFLAVLKNLSEPRDVLRELEQYDLQELMDMAGNVRDRRPGGDTVTFSPKAFIPLTRLCRDSCSYCTFVVEPRSDRRAYMSMDEVIEIALLGQEQGCSEALLTLGDKPELLYSQARDELHHLGYSSTIEYVKACAESILNETRLIPHINAGIMPDEEIRQLKLVSGSMGLMLESTSKALMEPGMPHYNCPDKEPSKRLEMLELAGKNRVPFTTGLLVGIGDARLDRIDGLLKIRDCHARYGHIQEVIIQNFAPKKNTKMAAEAVPSLEELLFTICACRLLMPAMNIQAPPNLTKDWEKLLEAGINDFGGISPGLTPDFVNPEKPWPLIQSLSDAVSAKNKVLLPRLPIYPEYVNRYSDADTWLSSYGPKSPMGSVLSLIDADGYCSASTWNAGKGASLGSISDTKSNVINRKAFRHSEKKVSAIPKMAITKGYSPIKMTKSGIIQNCSTPKGALEADKLIEQAFRPEGFSKKDIVRLFRARGKEFDAIISAADTVRKMVNGDDVSFVINRNINYTNICEYKCSFCAFSKGSNDEQLRGKPYLLESSEISRRTLEAVQVYGATEVCMQGGIHPSFTGEDYINILTAAKSVSPDIHIHAFSPLEIDHGARTLGLSHVEYLRILKDAGLKSLPGTAAEVLSDDVRNVLCPDKLNTREWVDIIKSAHSVGLPTTSTIMFGHVDSTHHWAEHLLILRDIQIETQGITEFVPLPFVHMEAPVFKAGKARAGPTLRECFLMHAIARLVLHPHIRNIQASWVKMGPDRASELLSAGCNDMGGTLINESITKAAGASFGQIVDEQRMKRLIKQSGKVPYQRTTAYQRI